MKDVVQINSAWLAVIALKKQEIYMYGEVISFLQSLRK